MAKYKLKALSCFLGGRLHKKEENKVFDSTNYEKVEFDALVKGGYFTEIKELKSVKEEEVKDKTSNKPKNNG